MWIISTCRNLFKNVRKLTIIKYSRISHMYQCHRYLDAVTNKSMNSKRKCRRSWCIGVVARRLKYSAGFWFGKHTRSDFISRGQEDNLSFSRREAGFRCCAHEFSPFIPLPHVNTSTKLIIRNGSDSVICSMCNKFLFE